MITTENIGIIAKSILYTMVTVSLITVVACYFTVDNGFYGSFAGALTALLVYAIAVRTASIIVRPGEKRVIAAALWLIISQIILWTLIAITVIKLKVNVNAYLLGFTALPISIIIGYVIGSKKQQN